MVDYQARRERLRRAVQKTVAGADALLVTSFTNVTYLTGFTGEDSYLLLCREGQILVTDPRFTTQLEGECPGLDLHIRRPGVLMPQAMVQVLRSARIGRLAIEADSMTIEAREKLGEKLPKMEIVSTSGLVEKLRLCKDRWEIAQIRAAVRQAQQGLTVVRATLRAEDTEKQLADELDYQMRLAGARGEAFPSVVAVGARAALPHATPTAQKLGEGDSVLIDWGANGGLYRSDLTRVLVTGRISPKLRRLREVYEVVLKAQTQAIAAIRPGAVCHDVDAVARGIIKDAGYGRWFQHGLGHGLGLEVHEGPRLARKSQTKLRAGMVVTVEPGVYLPGKLGVRIEDDVLVTRDGYEVLTCVPKEFDEVLVG